MSTQFKINKHNFRFDLRDFFGIFRKPPGIGIFLESRDFYPRDRDFSLFRDFYPRDFSEIPRIYPKSLGLGIFFRGIGYPNKKPTLPVNRGLKIFQRFIS